MRQGRERKHSLPYVVTNLADPSASASAVSRPMWNAGVARHQHGPTRSPSPPASAYFPMLVRSQDEEAQPEPTPDAEVHFAYSTTLRRHHQEGSLDTISAEATNLWQRAVGVVTGQPTIYEELPTEDRSDTYTNSGAKSLGDTPSARFAHCGVEVRHPCTHRWIATYHPLRTRCLYSE
jgi:Ca2+-transporting ATPase